MNVSTVDEVAVVVDTRTTTEIVLELGSLAAVSVVGIAGNSLVIAAIAACKDLKTTSNGFIFNLGIADLLICCLVIPMLISARAKRTWLLGDAMCIIQGFINFLCLYASLFFLAAIATNRFAKTWSMKYTQLIYTRRNTGIIFLTLWLMSVTAAALPVLGWGRYAFDNIRDNCIFDRRAAPSYSFFLASVGILLPLTICAVSYILVLITFLKSRSRVGDRGTINGSGATSRSEMRLTRNLFLVWLAFFVCWTPMISLLLIDPQGLAGRTAYVVAVWFMLCNSCINPIIYGLTNKKFRKGYQTVVRGCANRRIRTSRIQPTPTDVRRISRLKQRPGVGERGRFNPNLLQVRPLSPRRY